jgi:HAE1 family hydrophobic/amphiphilic exporter-1
VLRRNFPDYAVGLRVTIPLRNRRAQADVTRDLLERRRSDLVLQQQVNNVRREVQSAVVGLEQAHVRYLAARTTRELREKVLEGEEQKFKLGYSDTFKVVQQQRSWRSREPTRS